MKVPNLSNFAFLTNSKSSPNCSSVSPGKPTIKLVLNVTFGILFLIFSNKFSIFSFEVFLFILFNTAFDICCIGISKYLAILGLFATVSISSSVIPSGYEYKNLIHSIPFILLISCNSSANLLFP